MAGTWTTPRTWVDGETPTGAQFNTQLRDQLAYLKDSPTFDGSPVVSGTLTASGNVNAGLDLVASRNLGVSGTAYITGDIQVGGSATIGDAITDTVNIAGLIIGAPIRNYSETRVAAAAGGGYLVLDCTQGTYFTCTVNQDFTVAPRNQPPAGRAFGVTIIFTGDGAQRNVYWEGNIRWPLGVPPVITAGAGKRDIITLMTEDGGAFWYGVIAGQNY